MIFDVPKSQLPERPQILKLPKFPMRLTWFSMIFEGRELQNPSKIATQMLQDALRDLQDALKGAQDALQSAQDAPRRPKRRSRRSKTV